MSIVWCWMCIKRRSRLRQPVERTDGARGGGAKRILAFGGVTKIVLNYTTLQSSKFSLLKIHLFTLLRAKLKYPLGIP